MPSAITALPGVDHHSPWLLVTCYQVVPTISAGFHGVPGPRALLRVAGPGGGPVPPTSPSPAVGAGPVPVSSPARGMDTSPQASRVQPGRPDATRADPSLPGLQPAGELTAVVRDLREHARVRRKRRSRHAARHCRHDSPQCDTRRLAPGALWRCAPAIQRTNERPE
jgi:hypothetical protein